MDNRTWTVATWDHRGHPTATTVGTERDDRAVHAFARGQCHALAAAIHHITGWELAAIGPAGEPAARAIAGDHILHLVAIPPDASDDEVVDIYGRRTISATEWADYDTDLGDSQADLLPFSPALLPELVRRGWLTPARAAADHHAHQLLTGDLARA